VNAVIDGSLPATTFEIQYRKGKRFNPNNKFNTMLKQLVYVWSFIFNTETKFFEDYDIVISNILDALNKLKVIILQYAIL
jgi:hypothetical protein